MIDGTLYKLMEYARPYRWTALAATTFSALNKCFDVLPEVLIGVAIDVVINQQSSFVAKIGIIQPTNQLFVLGILTLIIWFLESLFEYLQKIAWKRFAQDLQHRMRIDCYEHVQNLDLAFFSENKSGQLITTINDDINQIDFFFDAIANELIHLVVGSIMIGGIFLFLSPIVALIAIIPLPLIWIISRVFRRHLEKHYAKIRELAGNLTTHIANNISGIETIKSYTNEEYEVQKIKRESNRYKAESLSAAKISALFNPVVRMAISISFIGALVVGGYLALKGKLAISVYSILVFQTQRFLWPFTHISQILDSYEWYMASIKRILKLAETPMERVVNKKMLTLPINGTIEFKQVTFTYKKNRALIQNLSFTIPAGKSVAFVGTTGSGKSTLIRLLLQLYSPTKGSILIDGQNTAEISQQSVRKAISFVSQEPFLFYGTIKDNIAYGKKGASLEEVRKAAKKAEIDEFIMQLPQKYSTHVDEQGKTLSGGQRQRIAIARALLKDAPIFIFDEATSAIDQATEQAIQSSLKNITEDHTTIIVAHRLTTIKHVDTIYVLHNGTIAESGTHSELITQNGAYKKLWESQS